jgi:tetratricopeptide (TPR) repeat protein
MLHGALLAAIAVAAMVLWVATTGQSVRRWANSNYREREEKLREAIGELRGSDNKLELLLSKYPESEVLLNEYCWNAVNRKDWSEALRRADIFVGRRPRSARAAVARFRALKGAGREEEATATLDRAMRIGRKDVEVLLAGALEAMDRKEWNEAVLRFARFRKYAPMRQHSYTAPAAALMELGRREEAEVLLAEGMQRLPKESILWVTAARIAETAGDLDEAIRRWEEMRARFPVDPEGYFRGAEALRRAGQNDAAAALIRQGRDFCPGDKTIAGMAAALSPSPD